IRSAPGCRASIWRRCCRPEGRLVRDVRAPSPAHEVKERRSCRRGLAPLRSSRTTVRYNERWGERALPVSKLTELPRGGGGRWPLCGRGFRSAKWGDMEVGYTTAGPSSAAPVYEFLPGKVCMCPHYGYVFKGKIRCTYPGVDWPDEVAEPGDVYFF